MRSNVWGVVCKPGWQESAISKVSLHGVACMLTIHQCVLNAVQVHNDLILQCFFL